MYVFKVNGNEYKVRFGYGVLSRSDLIDRVIKATAPDEGKDPAEAIKDMVGLTAELLLAGLQKRHSDEFGYETDSERDVVFKAVCDLIDDYEDEATEEERESGSHNGFTLFNDLQEELGKNGFLLQLTSAMNQTMENQNATVVPMDHQQKKTTSRGQKKS